MTLLRVDPEPDLSVEAPAEEPVPPDSDLALVRSALTVLSVLCTSLALHLVVVSSVQHKAAQHRAYARFRSEVAQGRAPSGPADDRGRLLAHRTPIAYLEIPRIGVHEIVGEGTTGGDLMAGPGHRRDSPFPGQAGTSVILGRQSSYGGPFNRLSSLQVGDKITVTTGQGVSRYAVISLRYGGEKTPPSLRANQGRLLLVSAAGVSYVPSEVVRVDADMTTPALAAVAPPFTAKTLPAAERIMGSDPSTLWLLAFWLQALLVIAVGAIWSWHRWGRLQTWLAMSPLTFLAAMFASEQALKLLPNLL